MMASADQVWLVCMRCGREIPHFEPHVSIDLTVEHTNADGTITVDYCESLFTACVDCAPTRSDIIESRGWGGATAPGSREHMEACLRAIPAGASTFTSRDFTGTTCPRTSGEIFGDAGHDHG